MWKIFFLVLFIITSPTTEHLGFYWFPKAEMIPHWFIKWPVDSGLRPTPIRKQTIVFTMSYEILKNSSQNTCIIYSITHKHIHIQYTDTSTEPQDYIGYQGFLDPVAGTRSLAVARLYANKTVGIVSAYRTSIIKLIFILWIKSCQFMRFVLKSYFLFLIFVKCVFVPVLMENTSEWT